MEARRPMKLCGTWKMAKSGFLKEKVLWGSSNPGRINSFYFWYHLQTTDCFLGCCVKKDSEAVFLNPNGRSDSLGLLQYTTTDVVA